MRPIVAFCGSTTYQLPKYLTNLLKPLADESRHKLQSTENFIDAVIACEQALCLGKNSEGEEREGKGGGESL